MTFRRTVEVPDTFGMCRKVARRAVDRATGHVQAEQGRHRGGPCPAVALATLTGWSYARAEAYLTRYGFRGAGMMRDTIVDAFTALLGRPTRKLDELACTVADVGHHFDGRDGIVVCRGHVMPVRGGRVLNASLEHLRMQATMIVVWDIEEVRCG